MVARIKDVMLEFGRGFSFIGEEYRLVSPSGTESFLDLLFYNRKLQNLVCIELKVGKFKPEYVGKMNYYLGLSGYKLSKNLPENMADKLPNPKQLKSEILREMDF